jgi:hypothetical protein
MHGDDLLQQRFSWIPLQATERPLQLVPVHPTMSAAEAAVARRAMVTMLNCILIVGCCGV